MTIVVTANALMWSMVTKSEKKGIISSIFRMLMVMVLTMFMMILTMMMISEEEYLKMVNCDKVREEWEDILNLD